MKTQLTGELESTKDQLLKLLVIQKWEKRLDFELGRFMAVSQVLQRKTLGYDEVKPKIDQKGKVWDL